MLGGVNAKKGRILNDVGWRKQQEGKDFQAICPEVEWPKTQEGKEFWDKRTGASERRNGVTPAGQTRTNRACFPDDARSTNDGILSTVARHFDTCFKVNLEEANGS